MGTFDSLLVWICVFSCFLSAWLVSAAGQRHMARQTRHRLALGQLLVTGGITLYFMLLTLVQP